MWSRRGLGSSALTGAAVVLAAAGCGSSAPAATPKAVPSPAAAAASSAKAAAIVPAPGSPLLVHDLTSGVTLGSDCVVTGFDGVLPNPAGNQCDQKSITVSPAGVTLTSSFGQLADGTQRNALFQRFDAHAGNWTIHAQLTGPINQLTKNYQQIALWFGPDTKNFVKVEPEHGNGTGPKDPDPHLTMYWDENGKAGAVGLISLPALTTAKTVDLYLMASLEYEITAAYSLDGGKTLVPVGHAMKPTDLSAWFSAANAKAGILTSNSGSDTTFQATFTKFEVTQG